MSLARDATHRALAVCPKQHRVSSWTRGESRAGRGREPWSVGAYSTPNHFRGVLVDSAALPSFGRECGGSKGWGALAVLLEGLYDISTCQEKERRGRGKGGGGGIAPDNAQSKTSAYGRPRCLP